MPKLSPIKQQTIASIAVDPDALMNPLAARTLCGRMSPSTFHRYRHAEDGVLRFPEPDVYLGNVPYWRRGTVGAWIELQAKQRDARRQVVKANAAKAQSERTGKAKTQNPAPSSTVEPQQLAPGASGSVPVATGRQQTSQFGG